VSGVTIVEFLTARLDEDEAVAREAAADSFGGPGEPKWKAYRVDQEGMSIWSADTKLAAYEYEVPVTRHVSRFDPARVLADITAKRAIVAIHQPEQGPDTWYWLQRRCKGCGSTWHKWLPDRPPTEIGPERGCPTLRALASVYADHPDYREEWKP